MNIESEISGSCKQNATKYKQIIIVCFYFCGLEISFKEREIFGILLFPLVHREKIK